MLLEVLQLVGSVPTGDRSNVLLWIIIAGAALVLIILCGAMAFIGKKSGKNQSDDKSKDKE